MVDHGDRGGPFDDDQRNASAVVLPVVATIERDTMKPITEDEKQLVLRKLARDLARLRTDAGNLKQGSVGAAPVGTMGPSVKRSLTTINDVDQK